MIAETDGESFYRGELAERIVSRAQKTGGAMTEEDLAEHRSEWVKPLSQDWHGVTLHELPPNGQGLTVLIALGILKHLAIEQYPVDSAGQPPSPDRGDEDGLCHCAGRRSPTRPG